LNHLHQSISKSQSGFFADAQRKVSPIGKIESIKISCRAPGPAGRWLASKTVGNSKPWGRIQLQALGLDKKFQAKPSTNSEVNTISSPVNHSQ